MKPLYGVASDIKGISGAVITAQGNVILVLDPLQLI